MAEEIERLYSEEALKMLGDYPSKLAVDIGQVLMNAITAIYPYKHSGLWVFDDERVGLDKEPFISGADTLIDRAVEAKGIRDAEHGFRLLFSAGQFPGYDFKFTWVRQGDGGNWYYSLDFNMEGWLCPALFRYFEVTPLELFAKFESRTT